MVFDRPTSVHSTSRCFEGGGFSQSAGDVVWEKQGCSNALQSGVPKFTARCYEQELMELRRGGSKLSDVNEGAMGKNAGAFPCARLMSGEGGDE